jgi:hypothetical protein
MLLTVQPIEEKSNSETEVNEEDEKDMELDSGELSPSYS